MVMYHPHWNLYFSPMVRLYPLLNLSFSIGEVYTKSSFLPFFLTLIWVRVWLSIGEGLKLNAIPLKFLGGWRFISKVKINPTRSSMDTFAKFTMVSKVVTLAWSLSDKDINIMIYPHRLIIKIFFIFIVNHQSFNSWQRMNCLWHST